MQTKERETIDKDNRALVRMWEKEEASEVSLKWRIQQQQEAINAHYGESTSDNEAKIRALYLKLQPNGYTEVFDEVEYYNDEVDERNYIEKC
jgi:hypothetical protein